MKKIVASAILLLAVLVAAPWGVGMLAEQRVNSGLDQLVETAPYLTIVERKFTRGWFTSEQEVTFEAFGPWLRALNPPAVAENAQPQPQTPSPAPPVDPLRFTVRNHIVHGPVLWLSGVGVARVDSFAVIPASIRAELVKVFGETPPVRVSTRVRFFGGGTTTFSGDARDIKREDKKQLLSYDAFEFKVGYSAHLDDLDVDGHWPRFEVENGASDENVVVSGIAVSGKSHRIRGDLYDSDFKLSIERVRIAGSDHEHTEIAGLHYIVDTTIDDDFMDVALQFGSGAVESRALEQLGLDLKEVHYDFTVRRLHLETLEKMLAAMKASYARPVATAAELDSAITQPLKEYGLALLKHDPEFVIDRIGGSTPDGDAYLKGIIKLKGVDEQDVAAGAMSLIGKLDADITIDMAQKLAGKLPNGAAGLAAALEQGYARLEGDRLVSRIEFRKGVLKINGKEQGIPGLGGPSQPPPPQE